MLKFRCQHCGQRIAVPARHLGKLVTCAECGRQTHPLAEQIVKSNQPAAPKAKAAKPAPEAEQHSPCANCGRTVGRLQAAHAWEGQQVCAPCYHALSAESSLGPARRATAAEPVLAMRVQRPPAATGDAPVPPPQFLGLRERLVRGTMVFVVGAVALYGALTLLRDIAGLIAVTAVAALALLALYGVFRSRLTGRAGSKPADKDGEAEAERRGAALVAVRNR